MKYDGNIKSILQIEKNKNTSWLEKLNTQKYNQVYNWNERDKEHK